MHYHSLQIYGFLLLLGALTAKALFDIKNWSSRTNLFELWIIFPAVFLLNDIIFTPYPLLSSLAKWIGIALFFAYIHFYTIEPVPIDDAFALAALLSISSPIIAGFSIALYVVSVYLFKNRLRYKFTPSKTIPTTPFLVVLTTIALLLTVI